MYLCFSVFFLLYYILLFAQSLNILSFAMSFLALAAVLFLAFRTVRKRPRDDRYVFLEGRPRSVRIAWFFHSLIQSVPNRIASMSHRITAATLSATTLAR